MAQSEALQCYTHASVAHHACWGPSTACCCAPQQQAGAFCTARRASSQADTHDACPQGTILRMKITVECSDSRAGSRAHPHRPPYEAAGIHHHAVPAAGSPKDVGIRYQVKDRIQSLNNKQRKIDGAKAHTPPRPVDENAGFSGIGYMKLLSTCTLQTVQGASTDQFLRAACTRCRRYANTHNVLMRPAQQMVATTCRPRRQAWHQRSVSRQDAGA